MKSWFFFYKNLIGQQLYFTSISQSFLYCKKYCLLNLIHKGISFYCSFASVERGQPIHVPRVANHGNVHFWNPYRLPEVYNQSRLMLNDNWFFIFFYFWEFYKNYILCTCVYCLYHFWLSSQRIECFALNPLICGVVSLYFIEK